MKRLLLGLLFLPLLVHASQFFGNSGGLGTVTSVGFSVPGTSIFGVTGSPVTTAGTINLTTTGTSGGVAYFSSTSQLASSALLTANALVLGGGAATAPFTLGSLGTTATVLHGNAAGAPSFGAVALGSDVSGQLPVANGGTGRATLTNHGVLVGAATTAITQLGAGSAGQVLQAGGVSADPAYSTATYPATATSAGTFLRADGTNWSTSTLTLPNTTTANQILYSSATSVVGEITTAATAALVTSSTSVPSFTSGSVANRVLRTNGTTITFAQVAAATDITGTLPAAQLPAFTGDITTSAGSSATTAAATQANITNLSNTAGVRVHGVSSNTAVTTGDVGEVVSSTVTTPTNFPTSATYGDLTSISLTAGDWLISANMDTSLNGATVNSARLGISSTSGNSATGLTDGDTQTHVAALNASDQIAGAVVPFVHVLIASTTTYYLKYRGVYTTATPQAVGRITALRIR